LFGSAQKVGFAGASFCRVPPDADTVYARTVRRAILDLGGIEHLAALLNVSTTEIESWLSGKTSPANAQFLSMLDVVAKGSRR
jgi:hypothetical protein